jgi:hypothetical protein
MRISLYNSYLKKEIIFYAFLDLLGHLSTKIKTPNKKSTQIKILRIIKSFLKRIDSNLLSHFIKKQISYSKTSDLPQFFYSSYSFLNKRHRWSTEMVCKCSFSKKMSICLARQYFLLVLAFTYKYLHYPF